MGSNMFNMVVLAILDLASRQERILRKSALKHALSGSLAVFMIGLVVFFIVARIQVRIGWVGLDSLVIMAGYIVSLWLIQSNIAPSSSNVPDEIPANFPGLATGILGFVLAAAGLVVVTPWMVRTSALIAETTGLGTTFVGSSLVALVTSLPELVTTLAALKIGASDMAIGNLFGSNLFNMFAIGLTDLFYTQGLFLGVIDQSFLVVGMLGLLMTGLGLIGNLARLKKRVLFLEVDALALVVVYFGGMWFLYLRGVAP
jgi:cation:H+ antiporter